MELAAQHLEEVADRLERLPDEPQRHIDLMRLWAKEIREKSARCFDAVG